MNINSRNMKHAKAGMVSELCPPHNQRVVTEKSDPQLTVLLTHHMVATGTKTSLLTVTRRKRHEKFQKIYIHNEVDAMGIAINFSSTAAENKVLRQNEITLP